jgi:hypothetical protein
MSYITPETTRRDPAPISERYLDRGSGWIAFAGTLLLILGVMNIIQGIAAIGSAHFYASDAHYVFGSLKAYGWVVLILGVLQGMAGVGIFAANQFARWGGVAILSLNAIAQLLMMPSYPFWSLTLFAVAILALYGLIAHGKETA